MNSLKRIFFHKEPFFLARRSLLTDVRDYPNVVIDEESARKFFSRDGQKIMKNLRGLDYNKVFRRQALGSKDEKVTPPKYQFMTTQQLAEAETKAKMKAYEILRFPPMVPINKGDVEILEEVPQIIGYDTVKYVLTDITYGINDNERLITVREPNGVLRKASSNERHRINQIYFPKPGRELRHPKMFEPEYLKQVLERGDYEFVLSRACCQFEPEDPEYHAVTFETFKYVDSRRAFDDLRSTRYYGPLIFYLCLAKNLDNLLVENMHTDRLMDAIWALLLYRLVNTNTDFSSVPYDESNQRKFIQDFIEVEAADKVTLRLNYEKFVDSKCERKAVS